MDDDGDFLRRWPLTTLVATVFQVIHFVSDAMSLFFS